ncbi:hypothetical protein JKP88DRAFT_252638 [Tribonema minus]|uniref:IPT/TIG domain-containing protein n=1 Tax=Tribonema minus TaxID=303371 RepID=A0A836CKS0_9STRA|nr:hypothetical protein JKP88DRAFT_252638 [Tribonema minus]
MRTISGLLASAWVLASALAALEVLPEGAHATGGATLTVTGADFDPLAGPIYTCNFQFVQVVPFTATSLPVKALSAVELECVVPVWKYFGAPVDFYIEANGVEVGDRLPFVIWEAWTNTQPTSAPAEGGTLVAVVGSGYDPSKLYRCRWQLEADPQTFMLSPLTHPVDYQTLQCETPAWGNFYNPEARDIQLNVVHFPAPGADPIAVPYLGPKPQPYFSFSAGARPWSAVTVSSGDPAQPAGSGVDGGDVVTFTGQDFNFDRADQYSCVFVQGATALTTQPPVVAAQTVLCLTPRGFAFEGAAALTLRYGAGAAAITVPAVAGAASTVFGKLAPVAGDTAAVPFSAVWTGAAVLGGVLAYNGGAAVTVSGRGFNPQRQYTCVWTPFGGSGGIGGGGGAVLQTAATPSGGGTRATCETPDIGGGARAAAAAAAAAEAYTLSMAHAVGAEPVIDKATAAGAQTTFKVGTAWLGKDAAVGGAAGGAALTVRGVGFTDAYECTFGAAAAAPATVVSPALLTCETPPDYGLTAAAGAVVFGVRRTAASDGGGGGGGAVLYGGSAALAEAAQTFTFVAEWGAFSPGFAPAASPVATTVLVEGQGFAAGAEYACGFLTPQCAAAAARPGGGGGAAAAADARRWEVPVDEDCYVFSSAAIVISVTAMRCPLPQWPYPAGATRMSVFGTRADGKRYFLGALPAAAAKDTFYFTGVVLSVMPAAGALWNSSSSGSSGGGGGGAQLEVAALGLSAATSTLYTVRLATGAGTDGVPVIPGNGTAYSDVAGLAPHQCSAPEAYAGMVSGAAAEAVRCVTAAAPLWPHAAGAAFVSLVGATGPAFVGAPYEIAPQADAHYAITTALLLDGVAADDVTLTAITELRIWLQATTGIAANACQVSAVAPAAAPAAAAAARKTAAAAAAAAGGSSGSSSAHQRSLAAGPTALVSVALAAPADAAAAGGLAAAQAAAAAALQAIVAAAPALQLASLPGLVAAAVAGGGAVELVASMCPAGTGRVEGAAEGSLVCGAVCASPSGMLPSVAPGYWRSPEAIAAGSADFVAYPFVQCLVAEACLGGPESACAAGSEQGSNLCAQCEDGFAEDAQGGLCDACRTDAGIRVRYSLLAIALLGAGAAALAWYLHTPNLPIPAAVAADPQLAALVAASSAAAMSAFGAAKRGGGGGGGRPRRLTPMQSLRSHASSLGSSSGSSAGAAAPPLAQMPRDWKRRRVVGEHAAAAAPVVAAVPPDQLEAGAGACVLSLLRWLMCGFGAGGCADSSSTNINLKAPEAAGAAAGRHRYTPSPLPRPIAALSKRLAELLRAAQQQRGLKAIALVTLAHIQVLSALAFGVVYFIRWPRSFASLLSALRLINLDVLAIPGLSLTCLNPALDFYDDWLVAVLFLPCAAIALAAVAACGSWHIARREAVEAEAECRVLQGIRFRAKCIQAFAWVAIAVYPGVSARVFALWNCRTLEDGTGYLWTDPSVECDGAAYNSYAGTNVVFLLAYPLGLPALLLYLLRRARRRPAPPQQQRAAAAAAAAPPSLSDAAQLQWALALCFASDAYRAPLWWWEPLDLVRRLVAAALLLYIAPASTAQLALGTALSWTFLAIHVAVRPHACRAAGRLHAAGLTVVAFCTTCGLAIHCGASGGGAAAALGALCLAANVVWFAALLPLAVASRVTRVVEGVQKHAPVPWVKSLDLSPIAVPGGGGGGKRGPDPPGQLERAPSSGSALPSISEGQYSGTVSARDAAAVRATIARVQAQNSGHQPTAAAVPNRNNNGVDGSGSGSFTAPGAWTWEPPSGVSALPQMLRWGLGLGLGQQRSRGAQQQAADAAAAAAAAPPHPSVVSPDSLYYLPDSVYTLAHDNRASYTLSSDSSLFVSGSSEDFNPHSGSRGGFGGGGTAASSRGSSAAGGQRRRQRRRARSERAGSDFSSLSIDTAALTPGGAAAAAKAQSTLETKWLARAKLLRLNARAKASRKRSAAATPSAAAATAAVPTVVALPTAAGGGRGLMRGASVRGSGGAASSSPEPYTWSPALRAGHMWSPSPTARTEYQQSSPKSTSQEESEQLEQQQQQQRSVQQRSSAAPKA